MTTKFISDLTAVATLADTDTFVVDDGAHNYKISFSALKALLKTVSSFTVDNTASTITITSADGSSWTVTPHDPSKQDKLTFDNTPTEDSDNPVKSGGVFAALEEKLNASDYTAFHGATSQSAGDAGIVPAPVAGNLRFLGSDGVWHTLNSSSLYGVCNTEAETAVKVVSIDGITSLTTGLAIRVMFTNANTASAVSLNVNNLGSIAIKRGGSVPVGIMEWEAQSVLSLVYTGSSWLVVSTSNASIPASGLVDSSGKISFLNKGGTELFNVQLPIFSGEVE